jgi:hypothetical protein
MLALLQFTHLNGNLKVTKVPILSSDSKEIEPPKESINFLQTLNPNPIP